MQRRFLLGQLVSTPGALKFAETHNINVFALVTRHLAGDWGDLCAEDKAANESALIHGGRLFSSYNVADDKLYIITEHDRSSTCVLLPREY